MSDVALQVRQLGKQYTIAGGRERYRTLRESITGAFRPRPTAGGKSFWALKAVDFQVNRGEVVGIIGRNGAGKSTLLKVLSRITEPTEGEVDINGRVGSLLEVGTGFHPELTGRENIFLNGAILGMRRAEIARRFDEIVAFAEVDAFLDTPVKYYSSGMYTRLAFSVAAHLEPEILIVDEVLAVGDAEFQRKCLGKMKDVSAAGRTVLFVSHNMNAVEQLCSSVLLLDKGRVAQRSESVRTIINDYLFTDDVRAASWTSRDRTFDNPYFRPRSLSVADATGRRLCPAKSSGDEAYVFLEVEIDVLDPGLTIGYAVFAEGGVCLYWSYQTDAEPAKWPALRQGRQRLRSRLPDHLFNEGAYRLELIGSLNNRQWLIEPGVNAPAVHFTVRGGLSESPHYTGARPTLLAPILEWASVEDG